MSASLVGSEMCIRDSPAESPLRHEQHVVRQAARGFSEGARRRQIRPVSYTHLTLPTICSV
eukprot:5388124-Alexandrium_andersonii.AAC.1